MTLQYQLATDPSTCLISAMKTPTSIELNLKTSRTSIVTARSTQKEKAPINMDLGDDNSSIDTVDDVDEVAFVVGLQTTQYQPPSNLSYYV